MGEYLLWTFGAFNLDLGGASKLVDLNDLGMLKLLSRTKVAQGTRYSNTSATRKLIF